MDGVRLAQTRAPELKERALAVTNRRGRPPQLALLAFADASGRAPHVERKVRAAAAVGVEILPYIVPAGASTEAALVEIQDAVERGCDGLFLQFPFPDSIRGDALCAAIPPSHDVDVMSPACVERYRSGGALAPVTVEAGVALLDAYGVDVAGRDGVVIAQPDEFAEMFAAALARRGARMRYILSPERVRSEGVPADAKLVVVSVGEPAFVRAETIGRGAAVIDVGYFNPGGVGDVVGAASHLEAIAPVPGGIGPMTVSVLLERTIAFAER